MSAGRVFSTMAFGFVLLCSTTVYAETAEQAFARGNALLEEGSFDEALLAYSVAARAERTNQQYRQQFMLVRRVVTLREALSEEADAQQWARIAQALRSFYFQRGIFPEALAVDERIHAKLNTAKSTGQLAETHLAMGQTVEASRLLSALPPEKATTSTTALLAIASARQGQMEKAKRIADGMVDQSSSDPGILYVLARMQSVVGNHDEAVTMLTQCFEAVPPSRLEDLKVRAIQSPDFATLASTDTFATVLETKSKVAESKCSSGSSCAGCPMRAKCAKDQGE